MEEVVAAVPSFAECSVVQRGAVYNNNLRLSEAGGSDFWESAIVHPDIVLADLVSIIGGEPRELYYFRSLGGDVASATLTHNDISDSDDMQPSTRATSHSSLWGIVLIVILALCSAYALRSYFERGATRHALLFTLLAIATIALAIGDLLIGSSSIPMSDVWAALTGGDTSAEYAVIINKLRLPKVIVAIIAGMALAASGLQMQSDPRHAYKAVRFAVYKRLFGGQLNILQPRRAGTKSLYEPPRKLRQHQRGGNRVLRGKRTTDLMSYEGSDRAFVLRFLNQGTTMRVAGTRGGKLHGSRGAIAARNWFRGASLQELQGVAGEMQTLIDKIIKDEFI
jgi:hypothetical protein